MQIKFKANTQDMIGALDTVALVSPRPVVAEKKETAGYLFVIRGERCYVYSRDALQVVRADFPVHEVEGEGAFIYPAAHAGAFRSLEDEIEFEIVNDGDTHAIKYQSGARAERTSIDPALLSPCDRDLDSATDEQKFSVVVLREALGLVKPFLAKADDRNMDDLWKIAQIFDGTQEGTAKGNGHLYASDSKRALYFFCELFQNKGFAVHGRHLGVLIAFLSKCDGEVTLRRGTNMMFAIDAAGRVLGWNHHVKSFSKFVYYPLKSDGIVLTVVVDTVLRALTYLRSELPSNTPDRVIFNFNAERQTVTLSSSDDKCKAQSLPIVVVVSDNAENRDFSCGVSLAHFRNLFEGSKGNRLNLRIYVMAAGPNRPKEQAIFRTVDEFWLDPTGKNVAGSGAKKAELPEGSVQCIATRLMPSMS
jgi:hypothetical protein